MTRTIQSLCALLCAVSLSASADPGPYFGVGYGLGDLDIDQSSFPGAEFAVGDVSGDVAMAEFSGGYRFENNFTVDVAVNGYSSFDFLLIGDVIDLSMVKLGGGYHFPSTTRLSGFVKGGVAFWDLQFKESFFLNPGPEETASRNGTNAFIEFGGEVRLWNRAALRLSYDVGSYDFGDARAVKLWLGANF